MDIIQTPSEAWKKLSESGPSSATAVPVNWWLGGLILANVSLGNVPELVVQMNSLEMTSGSKRPSSIQVTGLDMWLEQLTFNGQAVASFVLRPKQMDQNEVFFALSDHLVDEISRDKDVTPSVRTLEAIIRDWIDFWSKERSELSRETLHGLLGELIALDEFLDTNNLSHSSWSGPVGDPHDFRGEQDSLEVKVTSKRTGPLVHKISSVSQLQIPERGRLFVLSIRAKLSENGEHSFDDLVGRVGSLKLFETEIGRAYFASALEKAGYSSALPVEFARFDVFDRQVFEVKEGFPRILKDSIPDDPRLFDLTYSVDFSGAKEFQYDLKGEILTLS
jgi:hypothetical protein